MRLLMIFGAVCLLMAGLAVWGLWPQHDDSAAALREWRAQSAPQSESDPATENAAPRAARGGASRKAAESSRKSVPGTGAATPTEPTPAEAAPPSAREAGDPNVNVPWLESQPAGHDGDVAPPAPLHWAGTFDRRDAERRLELALATLRDDPAHPEALRDTVTLLARLQRWSAAARYLDRLVGLRPDDAELRFEYGALLMRMRRFTDAIDNLQRAVELDPAHAAAWFNLAVARQRLGHLSGARRAWDAVIELEPSAAARAQRGEVLLDLGDWPAAAADLEAVLEADPAAVDVTLNLVTALEQLDRIEDAARRLRECLAAHPRSVPALNRLAALAWRAGQSASEEERARWREEVVEFCRRSLEMDANQPEVRALLEEAGGTAP